MQLTPKGLKKPELTDNSDLTIFIGENMDLIDILLSSSSSNLNQYSKLDVIAPYIKEITFDYNINLNFPAIEVLKFIPGNLNSVTNIYAFNNNDSSSFEQNEFVIFDGKMKLKTDYSFTMDDNGIIGSGRLWSKTIDISQLQEIIGLGVV